MNSLISPIMNTIADGVNQNVLFVPALIIASLSALAILTSVALKFAFYSLQDKSLEKKCPVSTITMILVLLPFVPLVTKSIGVIKTPLILNAFFFLLGSFLIIIATSINVIARITIERFWSDHIVIHAQHEVIDKGVFAMVRHPMYSSLIFYNLGLACIFQNHIIFLINLIFFMPMMVYRAKQEELQIFKNNKKYHAYSAKTPFLIPNPKKIINKKIIWFGHKKEHGG
ncbi:MAG: isoprenylcysteine carboxylmethyltransferase family protein [Desulfobacteraceae bacterium]|nr:isoprenylcysteine carboxylmethyltransferase family protein [Desulfobacteraceae bacterium]